MATKRKPRVLKERPRNNGTFTEAMFWSYLRATLRNRTRFWKPIVQCRLNGRRAYKGANKRQKFEYQCNYCKKWFTDKNVAVDHIIPAGALNCAADLPGFVERLFVEVEGLQLLCNQCHDLKTKNER